jgi:multiple sugar transport system permease protein
MVSPETTVIHAVSPPAPGVTGRLLRTRRARHRLLNVFTVVMLLIGTAFVLLPLFWIVDTAFKPQAMAFSVPPQFIYRPTLANFQTLISGIDSGYISDVGHSLVLLGGSVAAALLLGTPCGYALARSRFRGSGMVTGWLIVVYITPALVYIVPLYAVYVKLHLEGSMLGLILYYETFELPFVVFLTRGYFADVPKELDEAARIDGCSRWLAFRRVILPLIWPGLATVTILTSMMSWGEYFGALIFSNSATETAPVALQNQIGFLVSDWSAVAAGALILVLPVLLLTAVAQRGYMRQVAFATNG